MTRKRIFELVEKERHRQNQKWGRDDLVWNASDFVKLTVLAEEFGEVAQAMLEFDEENLEEELVQVMAVTCAILESKEEQDLSMWEEKTYPKDEDIDLVNRPPHYAEGRKYEPIDVILDWKLPYTLGNAVKYLSRIDRKGTPEDSIRDLEKAVFYINKEIKSRKAFHQLMNKGEKL